MDTYIFRRLRNHTNTVESMGQQSYSAGVRLEILPAIYRTQVIDRRMLDQYRIREDVGVRQAWRRDSGSARQARETQRSMLIDGELIDNLMTLTSFFSSTFNEAKLRCNDI